MTTLHLKPGDMLETPGHVGSHLYHVASVLLGGANQESLVELVPLDQTRPADGAKTVHPLVPLSMIEAGAEIGIFHHTAKEEIQ